MLRTRITLQSFIFLNFRKTLYSCTVKRKEYCCKKVYIYYLCCFVPLFSLWFFPVLFQCLIAVEVVVFSLHGLT